MVQGHTYTGPPYFQLMFEIGLTQTQKSYLVTYGVRAVLFVVQYGFQ